MNDAFADALGKVVVEVTAFHEELRARRPPSLEQAFGRFVRLIDEFAEKGRTQGGRATDYMLAQTALVYWIDEMLILHFGWEHADDFRAICLELHYPELKTLKNRSPGERERSVEGPYRFYEMADVARTSEEPDSLEAFLLCAALGFRGKYDDEDELEAWVRQIHDHVKPRLQRRDRESSLDRIEGSDGVPLKRLQGQHLLLGVSTIVAITALITLVVFIVAVHFRPY